MKNAVFFLGMGTLFTHELDAMLQHEWRILPLTSWLPDETARWVFIVAHVPLFAILIALVASERPRVRLLSRRAVAAFLPLHALLHTLFAGHEHYTFSSLLSQSLIYGGAALGVAYLILEFVAARRSTR